MVLCSNCNSNVRPIVAVDIDGTLADYHTTFEKFCMSYWNTTYSAWSPSYTGKEEFHEYLGLTLSDYRQAKLAYRQGGMKRSMPMYPDARVFLNELADLDVDLWIATTRPWQRLDNIDPDTQFWLQRHGIHFHGMLYGEDKYSQLLDAVGLDRIIGIVEDLPEQIDIAESMGLSTWMVARDHNLAYRSTVPRVGTLAGAAGWLRKERYRK